MKLYISHQSALEYWRRHRKLPVDSAARRCRDTLPNRPFIIEPPVLNEFEVPINIMIANSDSRRISKMVKQHIFGGETPVGCFMNMGSGLMVSSPEFCFLQMANQLVFAKLIELGYEICGVYSQPLADDASVPYRGFYNRRPLTNIKKLKTFLDSMHGAKGYKKAAQALSYLCSRRKRVLA